MNKKHEEYLNSPYKMNGIVERAYTTKTDETLTVDPETGQMYTMKKVSQNKRVLHDGMVYSKLFQESVSMLMDLSHPSLRIILYAMSVVRPLSESVMLHAPDVCVACGMAEKTFYNNLMELLDKNTVQKAWLFHRVLVRPKPVLQRKQGEDFRPEDVKPKVAKFAS